MLEDCQGCDVCGQAQPAGRLAEGNTGRHRSTDSILKAATFTFPISIPLFINFSRTQISESGTNPNLHSQPTDPPNLPTVKMRFYLLTLLLALFIATALAIKSQKAVLITYPADTPDSEVDKAIETLKNAGGMVTHEFSQ